MLNDLKIQRNAKFESSIPKMCMDERYTVVDMENRKRLFVEYQRSLDDQPIKRQKVEKKNMDHVDAPIVVESHSKSDDIYSYREMLRDQRDLTKKSTWSEVKGKFERDPRFQSIQDDKKREQEFYSYLNHDLKDVDSNLCGPGVEEFTERVRSYVAQKKLWKDIEKVFEDDFEHLDKESIYISLSKSQNTDTIPSVENIFNPKDEFIRLLEVTAKETKFLTKNTPTFGKKFIDLKKHLQLDSRWKLINGDDEKDELITSFIWSLGQRK